MRETFIMNKKTMMDYVYSQLAIDYNCSLDNFLKDGLIITEAKDHKDRRPFPWRSPRLEIVAVGHSMVINASADILPYIREKLEGKTSNEVYYMPLFYGINQYYLPDIGKITKLDCPDGFEYELVEKDNIHKLYKIDGFNYAMQYDINSQRPDVLIALARHKDEIVGMAGASADCKTMWQIGLDVLLPYRGKGLAAALVNMLTIETLNRGYVPYYGTSGSNVISQHVAVRAGYMPAWVHSYRARLDGILTTSI